MIWLLLGAWAVIIVVAIAMGKAAAKPWPGDERFRKDNDHGPH